MSSAAIAGRGNAPVRVSAFGSSTLPLTLLTLALGSLLLPTRGALAG